MPTPIPTFALDESPPEESSDAAVVVLLPSAAAVCVADPCCACVEDDSRCVEEAILVCDDVVRAEDAVTVTVCKFTDDVVAAPPGGGGGVGVGAGAGVAGVGGGGGSLRSMSLRSVFNANPLRSGVAFARKQRAKEAKHNARILILA